MDGGGVLTNGVVTSKLVILNGREMKKRQSEKDIRVRIGQIKQDYSHILEGSLSTIQINAPRALMQVRVIGLLETLYWVLGENFQHKWKGKPNT